MQEKLERSKKRAKLAAKTMLSFGGDDDEEGDAEVQSDDDSPVVSNGDHLAFCLTISDTAILIAEY